MCDIQVSNCKTRMYVYETKCSCCYGTGMARGRAGSHGRGGRSGRLPSLRTCLVCTGLGYVRVNTARDGVSPSELLTLARQQRLHGEPERQESLPPSTLSPTPGGGRGLPADAVAAERLARLRRAKEVAEAEQQKQAQQNGVSPAAATATSASSNGNSAAATTRNNIVTSTSHLGAAASNSSSSSSSLPPSSSAATPTQRQASASGGRL